MPETPIGSQELRELLRSIAHAARLLTREAAQQRETVHTITSASERALAVLDAQAGE